jgi:hypothetical protein
MCIFPWPGRHQRAWVWAAYLEDEHAVVERISLVRLAEAARDLRAQISKQDVKGRGGERR